jgi:hypothetical protein
VIDDLTALRQAAEERNPEQTQFLLKRIFLQMPFYRAMAVAVEQLHRYVETFEREYPQAKWARQVLVQIASIGTAPGELPADAMREYEKPGAMNYVKALSDLAHATRQSNQLEARVGYLVSAVVNAMMAELVESWYRQRLDEWARVRGNQFNPATGQYSDPEATMIAYRFWTDDNVAQRDTALWLQVVGNIETKMKR